MLKRLALILLFIVSTIIPLQAVASTAPTTNTPETFICRYWPSLPFCRGGW